MEDDDLDLVLPAKKKKPKKVDFVEEGDTAEKEDGERTCPCILIMIFTICYLHL